jgi:hypothetical protein
MQYPDDPRIAEAKQKGMDAVLAALDITNLKRDGPERIGPCPRCGGDDRFGVNVRKGQFLCRRCDGKGDEIALVMFVLGLDFRAALDWICGPVQEISDDERRARAQRDQQNRDRKDREEAEFRKRAIGEARKIWRAGLAAANSPVRDYLALRGITPALLPDMPRCLRFAPDLPFMVAGKPGEWLCAHRGPAMLAVIQGSGGGGTGVHRTWFDLAAPQGKVRLTHPLTGEAEGRKKSWGSKKGGAIRLIHGTTPVLVMGEGIETTLTAAVAGVWPGAHFWAGIDLGNMSGRRESGKGLKYAGLPDLDDPEAFVPPPWVRTLIYVQDGDSDPRDTRAKLEAGLRRAMMRVPGLKGQIAPCPDGKDLNDVLLEGAT